METEELLEKIRRIEIRTRRSFSHLFSGDYHSAFKGQGMSFSEVREYQPGDEIRTIDWNVTARFNHPYVKVFEEERELNVVLMIDVSRSGLFGSVKESKQELITEIGALLAYSALGNHDKVSVIFFSDKVEQYIPPKKGRAHLFQIIRELINFTPASPGTDLSEALRFLNSISKQRSVVFILSDFMTGNYDHALRISAGKHDVIGLHIYDQRELDLPDLGLLNIVDSETGEQMMLDTSGKKIRAAYSQQFKLYFRYFQNAFRRSGTDIISISTADNYVRLLMRLFERRVRRA